jgi:hypothetical protein
MDDDGGSPAGISITNFGGSIRAGRGRAIQSFHTKGTLPKGYNSQGTGIRQNGHSTTVND